mgnify:CR=1 FL=1
MIRFLLKGLLRDRSRSLLPFFTVVLGSALTVIGYSWINGAMSSMIESGARFSASSIATRASPSCPSPMQAVPRRIHAEPRAG